MRNRRGSAAQRRAREVARGRGAPLCWLQAGGRGEVAARRRRLGRRAEGGRRAEVGGARSGRARRRGCGRRGGPEVRVHYGVGRGAAEWPHLVAAGAGGRRGGAVAVWCEWAER